MTALDSALETGWGLATSDDDNLFLRFVRNQGDLNTEIALASGGRAAGAEGVVLSDSGGAVAYLNQATVQRPLLGLDDPVLDQVDDFWAGEGGRPNLLLSVWPTPDLAPRGWSLVGHPAFVARPPGPHGRAARPGVAIERVVDAAALLELERVVVEGYPVPEASGLPPGSVLQPPLLDTSLRYWLGRLGGKAVAAASSHVGRGVVNLCLAATMPEARRQGVWGALVWARVDEAPHLPAVAFTSDHSRPGFEHLGFLVISRCTLWARA